MSAPTSFRYISKPRRVVEDRRFVVGKGHYAGDIAAEGMLHVALVPSTHPAARIIAFIGAVFRGNDGQP